MKIPLDKDRAAEAKAIVVQAFRNGPIEDLHTGKVCPVCSEDPSLSRISDAEMKAIMKAAVTQVYKLLWLRDHDIEAMRRSWHTVAGSACTGTIPTSDKKPTTRTRMTCLAL